MGFFDFLRGNSSKSVVKTYSVDSVQITILQMMEEYISNTETFFNLPVPVKNHVVKPKEVEDLITAGFTSHKKVLEYNANVEEEEARYERAVKYRETMEKSVMALRFLINSRKHFGSDTLLIPYNKFEQLCHKYDLKCGELSSYMGDVPSDKLQEIISLQYKTGGFGLTTLFPIKKYINDYGFSGEDELLWVEKHCDLFPFLTSNKPTYTDGYTHRVYRQASGNELLLKWVKLELGKGTHLFITAPKSYFKEIPSETNQPKDPFICAHTRFGILIFTRWGEEANDEIIKKYEAFNHKLDELNLIK